MVGEATAAGERAVVARAEARMAAAMAAVATAVGGDGGGVETDVPEASDARGAGCPRHRLFGVASDAQGVVHALFGRVWAGGSSYAWWGGKPTLRPF